MPDRTDSCASQPEADVSTLTEPAFPPAKVYPVGFPLDDFYARAATPMPEIITIEAAAMPEPDRSLLVHNHDMTPTLSAYHARIIHLRVLSRQQRDDFYFREVLLLADGMQEPVEFGAIRINLALFGPAARRHILDERVPLGHLLRVHSVAHSSRPKAFFKLSADALMARALHVHPGHVLYGRRNTLLDAVQRPLAEVVEILPPARQPAAGYLRQTEGA